MRDFNDLTFIPEKHTLELTTVTDPINNNSLRFIKETYGEPPNEILSWWFVGQDWLKALGYKKSSTLITITQNTHKKFVSLDTTRGTRNMAIISLSRLEDILDRCKNTEAKSFIDWAKYLLKNLKEEIK